MWGFERWQGGGNGEGNGEVDEVGRVGGMCRIEHVGTNVFNQM